MKDYKTILEGVVNIINTTEKSDIGFANICTYIGEKCPELAESEDEKIRKFLIQMAQNGHEGDKDWWNKCVAWLEKQGEHAKFRESIQIGDEVTRNKDGMLVNLSQLKRVAKPASVIPDPISFDEKTIESEIYEQKTAENVELSAFKDKLLELFQRFRWYCKDETPTNGDIIEYVNAHIQELIDTTQNPTWSEWDRILQDSSISYLCNLRDTFETKGWDKEQIQKCINWLQSLRPQNTWKPSDEQMKALDFAANYIVPAELCVKRKVLKELLEQLKKLK